jgi:hypothetical protein
MLTHGKKLVASAFLGAAVLFTPMSTAWAQTTVGDGLVNVAVGNITIEDAVDIGVAAQVAANICGVKVGPVAVLGAAVDKSGKTTTVCETDQGDVTIKQN